MVHYLPPASAVELELEDNEFWCFSHGSTIPDVGTCSVTVAQTCTQDSHCPVPETCVNPGTAFGAAPADFGKSHFAYAAFTNAALDNTYGACGAALPIQVLSRTAAAPTDPDPVDIIDPRPAAGSVLLTTNRATRNDGFFMPAAYQGAFTANTNWAEGWTTMSRLGFFPPRPVVTISANITTSQLWTAGNDYLVTQPVYVTSGATLTIEPGTVVRGEGESAPGANDPGTVHLLKRAQELKPRDDVARYLEQVDKLARSR